MKKTLVEENVVLKEIQLNGSISLKDAMTKLNISPATARRLFSRMEEKGLGIRSHGKISLPDSSFSFYRYETSKELYVKEKKQISNEAVKKVCDGDMIFLDSGTTVCLFAMALNDAIGQGKLKNIKVFTNSFMIINIMKNCESVNMIGGIYRPFRKDFCGFMAEKSINEFRFNKSFLGTDGFCETSGFTTTDFDTARICNAAINCSDNVIILADSHKIGKAAAIGFAKGDKISLMITDSKLSDAQKKLLYNSGVNFVSVEND